MNEIEKFVHSFQDAQNRLEDVSAELEEMQAFAKKFGMKLVNI